ncbi:hypothetical protein N7478_008243 [Penicillium angulare]|uniref:uncharacterized protein n=1 Tax=Penicillium angulare TaxID=116970 RepID=UPI0025412337|nr:uncharacterized protein N7478_008243 [Penicillium angulare]KAJ5273118.1 hypothetical protein N7478_008243 [Penicillium angulare]
MDRPQSPDYQKLYLELMQTSDKTTFAEFLRGCHDLLSRPLQIEPPSRPTTGQVPSPIGKYCPTKLRQWADCASRQQKIYDSVCKYFGDIDNQPHRLFWSIGCLQATARHLPKSIHSERTLRFCEDIVVNANVRKIIEGLCQFRRARQEFQIERGVFFDRHSNSLEVDNPGDEQSRPDHDCIHRLDGTRSLLMTLKYQPPHILTTEHLRLGLREMDFWQDVVRKDSETTAAESSEKIQHDAERTVGAVLTQVYDDMICQGLEYSWITNGLALVLLHIPYNEPSTLEYFLCDPLQVKPGDLQEPNTAVARVLCLILMGCLCSPRDTPWRESTKRSLHRWGSALISNERQEIFNFTYPGSSVDPDLSSLRPFCTQKCLKGLQQNKDLDPVCPNVHLHQQDKKDQTQHLITIEEFTQQLKEQIVHNIDRCCISLGNCGISGAPFKVICSQYGYTIFGKGTTDQLWPHVSREEQVYYILRDLQGSIVPVFLGPIDLCTTFFLHGAGRIRHMLLMAYGGEHIDYEKPYPRQIPKTNRARKAISSRGIEHGDFRLEHLLWSAEMESVMVIDFHAAILLKKRRPGPKEKKRKGNEDRHTSHVRQSGLKESMSN